MEDRVNPLYRGDGEFDKTQLREKMHGKRVHRDYLAHALRWGWATRQLHCGDHVLEIGCGQDQPLAKVIEGQQSFKGDPEAGRPTYVGVDLNKIPQPFGARWATIIPETNLLTMSKGERAELIPTWGAFTVGVSFEVIEHMTPEWGEVYLQAYHEALYEGAPLYLSTPVYNGKAAKNHIHEYGVDELRAKIERNGFEVVDRWGTFMSWNDMVKVATPEQQDLATQLRHYLGPEVVACFLAPLYPDHARNNVWVCRKRQP